MTDVDTNKTPMNMEEIKATIWDSVKTLKEARVQMGWSIAELSRRSSVSVGVISDLENNKGKVPSLANFIALTRTLHMSEFFVLRTIQGIPSQRKQKDDKKELEYMFKNCLRDMGLYDSEAINFLYKAMEFARNRKPINNK